MIYTYEDAPNVRATLDSDTYRMTVYVDDEPTFFDDGATSELRGSKTEAQACAMLLGFYSAFAEYAWPASRSWEAEDMARRYSDEQREALYMIGPDGFTMWAEEIAPTCAEGCGRYVAEPGGRCDYCGARD